MVVTALPLQVRETQTPERGTGPLVELGGPCGAGNQTSEDGCCCSPVLCLSGGTWRWASVGSLGSIVFARVILTETGKQTRKK